MLISMNWISEFVNLDGLNLKELIGRFTLSTAEVEDIYEYGTDISNVVSAKILEIENHPSSKKLHILKVDDGKEVLQVVCGAPNVKVGMIVPFARIGATLGDIKITKAMLLGVESYGMCCSESEIGISDDHSGLLEMDENTKLGVPVNELFNLNDIVFEVDNKSLTNRPDLWGHYGIAREFAALTDRKLLPLELLNTDFCKNLKAVPIDIVDKDKCYRYSGITVSNIKTNVSPIDMKIRLHHCGMRSVNLLADLTNYVMLELGQPMHAFDNNIVDNISVKTFDKPFTFLTLDEQKREIDTSCLMICSSDKPVAIAGIMGGMESAISKDTNSVLIESANFNGVSVRKSSSKLGLRTDASARYEKILDPEITVVAIERFLKILKSIDENIEISSSLTDLYVYKYPEINLEITKSFIDKYTGIEITNDTILKTLKALGFVVSFENDVFKVKVPSFRATKDVTIKADLIEEITRIYGYDNFEIKTTKTALVPVRQQESREDEYAIKILLAEKFSFNEIHSYIWNNDKLDKELEIDNKSFVKIQNSISGDMSQIRSSIIPTLLHMLNNNKSAFQEIQIFEIGRVVVGLDADKNCIEQKNLSLLVASKTLSEKEVYYKLKDIISNLTKEIKNILPTFDVLSDSNKQNYLHPYNSQDILLEKTDIGFMSMIHPSIKNNIDKKIKIAVAEINLEKLELISKNPIVYNEVSRFPSINIDLSLIVNKSVKYTELSKILNNYNNEFLTGFDFVDIYQDETLCDSVSITIRFNFNSLNKTLSLEQVEGYKKEIVEMLSKENITLR
ncbi:MAG: phenylalanine--tRNA ligase subunit beta [Clostridia bacterium]